MMNTLVLDGTEYRLYTHWLSDDKPETTPARVYVSECGKVVTAPYRSYSVVNKSYRNNKLRTHSASFRGEYLRVSINDASHSLHRAIAKAWCEGYFEGAQVNHKDGDKTNNHASNLEWCTASYNQLHVSSVLGKRCGEDNCNSVYTTETILKIKELLANGLKGHEICKELGVNKYIVSDIKRGKAWKHLN